MQFPQRKVSVDHEHVEIVALGQGARGTGVEGREVAPEESRDDALLWRAVDALPDKQRQATVLYYQDERTVEEVAEMMGLPANTVKTHLHRARAALAAALGQSGLEAM